MESHLLIEQVNELIKQLKDLEKRISKLESTIGSNKDKPPFDPPIYMK